jgi:hypothetical protein
MAAPCPLTIRFTMMILGPSVLLTVKMCISRRQKMMKSRERITRPGYSVAGMSLVVGQGRDTASGSAHQVASQLPEPSPNPGVATGGT